MIATTTLGETTETAGPAGSTAGLPEFSLVAGGPLYRIMCRLKLADGALGHLNRRILAALLIAWLPLLVLTVVEGHGGGG
jgi:hypothetical protein